MPRKRAGMKYDATLKWLLEFGPPDWLALAGYPGTAELTDADVATVSAASDKVLRARGNPDWLMDVNFQAGPDASLPQRMRLYNVLLEDRHGLLVRSVAVLLAPKANLKSINGVYERAFPGQSAHLTFRYQVIRVWELSTEQLLQGGLATLPLAPLGDVTEHDLPGIVEQMRARLGKVNKAESGRLWTATNVLMGLRYEPALTAKLLQGVTEMEESATYQAIVAKGRVQEARRLLLLLGRKHLGEPGPKVVTAVESIEDQEALENLALRVPDISSWNELLPSPAPRRRKSTQ